ncbi:glycoside hydrolase [Paenibacillus oenotherae]|uniref:Glycoside hydrolase n=1 Tax=Paenibacillus oenotherae TaxID=1435645 RepID=A0ABS7D253_9BACL|nr:glycosyl hydrolase family 18 protein [Paenibacillus oenotherae]MBW7473970.1 glycoside hydrolase [Paenibacillus oenotherae]
MRQKWSLVLAVMLILQASMAVIVSAAGSGSDQTTKFRVYQNDRAVKEFATSARAIAFAKSYPYSHVERIEGRGWIWDNLPRYKVYENGYSTTGREFATLNEAKAFAKKLRFAQIRDLQKPGWVSGTYANYAMYQGDKTLPNWTFATLAEAKNAAKAYSNIHIIELSTNQWIWDNLTAAQKQAQRKAAPVYDITVDGATSGGPLYPFLLDAIRASTMLPGSSVVNTATGRTVHMNTPSFVVTQNGKAVKSFYGAGSAVKYASTLSGSAVTKDGSEWWTNVPYLKVKQNDRIIRYFHTRKGAVDFANGYKNAVVATADGRAIWNNRQGLMYLAWNGTSRTDTVLAQVSGTQGLDVDSPTWFELADAAGTLTDSSDPALVTAMRTAGIKLTPLVHNQFDAGMTSAFLRDEAAKSKFIGALVGRLAALGVDGVNLDFEALAGGDRALYTAFVRSLTEAAHAKGLTVSIDLPRGDVLWDHKTAYDHAALAGIVDMIMIMAYDQHWSGSDTAGSVAQLKWVEDGVKTFLAYGIPRSKLMLGIPFYVREWRVDASGALVDNKAIIMKEVPRIIAENNAKGVYDAASGQTKYSYAKNGYTHVFWAETAGTVKARIDIAAKYDLAGVAAWRLGYESADLWTMMLQQK